MAMARTADRLLEQCCINKGFAYLDEKGIPVGACLGVLPKHGSSLSVSPIHRFPN